MLQRWLVMGVSAASLAVVLAGAYAWAARPASYGDAVREALDRRHVVYTDLDVREICLPDPRCLIGTGTHSFAMVVVHGNAARSGLITCYDRRGDCYLDVPSLGIRRAPLRDLRSVRWLPKQAVREIAPGRMAAGATAKRHQRLIAITCAIT